MLCTLELPTTAVAGCRSTSEKTADELLIAAIVLGDKRALERLYSRHSRSVYHFIVRLTHDAGLADELVGDVFLAAWRNAANFKGRSRVSTWLLAIARYKALEAQRHRTLAQLEDSVAEAIPDEADDPELNSHHVSRRTLIQRCLTQLPQRHRELIDLVYYHHATTAEAAQIVGVPEGTVKSRMAAARLRLAELLKRAGLDRYQEC
jgi:RNA polymerase sigma-70 factor (ECF subfamily)